MPSVVDADMGQVGVTVSADRVADVADITDRQLRSWERLGVAQPSIDRRLHGRRHVRLYSFDDVVGVYVAAELQRRGFATRRIAKVAAYLRRRSVANPMTDVEFATAGGEIMFKMPDGVWQGDRDIDQTVERNVLDLDDIRETVRSRISRRRGRPGDVEKRRGRMSNTTVFAGTRIPVAAIAELLADDVDEAWILRAYPSLTSADIETARAHAAA